MTLEEYRFYAPWPEGQVPVFAGERLPTGVIYEEPITKYPVPMPDKLLVLAKVAAASQGWTVDNWLLGVIAAEVDRLTSAGGQVEPWPLRS